MEVVKLAIDMYTGRRRIVQDKVYSKAVRPKRGVIAGCSIATTIIKVCFARQMKKVAEKFPRIVRRIYLDDISLQWKGRWLQKRKVKGKWLLEAPREFIEAVLLLVELLTKVLKAKVSSKSR